MGNQAVDGSGAAVDKQNHHVNKILCISLDHSTAVLAQLFLSRVTTNPTETILVHFS